MSKLLPQIRTDQYPIHHDQGIDEVLMTGVIAVPEAPAFCIVVWSFVLVT